MNDDLPPLPDDHEAGAPAKPTFWETFLGPANAAGFGGWAGMFGPLGAWIAWEAARSGAGLSGVMFGLICGGPTSMLLGVLAGGVGSRVVLFVERRRGAHWPPWRSQFLAGFAAGALSAVGLAVLGAVLANG